MWNAIGNRKAEEKCEVQKCRWILIWRSYSESCQHMRWVPCGVPAVTTVIWISQNDPKWSIKLWDDSSLKLTWHLKITPWKRRFLQETIIFRGYVSSRECTYPGCDSYLKSNRNFLLSPGETCVGQGQKHCRDTWIPTSMGVDFDWWRCWRNRILFLRFWNWSTVSSQKRVGYNGLRTDMDRCKRKLTAILNFWISCRHPKLAAKVHFQIWVFPKIVPPKWMVDNGKPY